SSRTPDRFRCSSSCRTWRRPWWAATSAPSTRCRIRSTASGRSRAGRRRSPRPRRFRRRCTARLTSCEPGVPGRSRSRSPTTSSRRASTLRREAAGTGAGRPATWTRSARRRGPPAGPPSRWLSAAAGLLGGAWRPLIISGGGIIAADAESELVALARRLGAPVITTVMGRGAISERDSSWHGVLPNGRATEQIIRAADVILAVGCRFAHRSTQGLLLNLSFSAAQTLIHLDLDPTVLGRLFKPQLGIVGDARDGLTRMLEDLGPGRPRDTWDHTWRAALRGAANARNNAAPA